MRKKSWWPISVGEVSASELRTLGDEDFKLLVRRVKRRERETHGEAHANSIARKLQLMRRTNRRIPFSQDVLLARHRECPFLDALVANRKTRWLKIKNRRRGVTIACKNFSFIDNPLPTFEALSLIAEAECEAVNFRVDFLDTFVQDIGPYLVLGMMRERMAPVVAGGKVHKRVIKVLEAVRLREFLKMGSFGKVSMRDVWPFPLTQRRRSGTSTSKQIALQPTTTELTADQIVEKVNYWLRELEPAQELTEHGASKIKGMVGEILNNAERHSRVGGDGEWITAGFMARRDIGTHDPKFVHICHLCFFNPGRPISETIRDAPAEIKAQIERYIAKHTGCGVCDDTLATVFALQDGISRVLQGDGNPSGGTGLMDVVEFANEVGISELEEKDPKVVIISGSSLIRFDAPYRRGLSSDSDGRRLQWFNAENDVMEPPDPSHVMDLPIQFPGTLISVRVVLDGSFDTDGNE
jgi:hypothetical protein